MRKGRNWWAAGLTHTAIVVGVAWTYAVSPPPDCQNSISAQLTATPSFIDRETSPSILTTLAWSVSKPANCPAPRLSLAGRTVALSGKLTLEAAKTTTYRLQALFLPGARELAAATVTVNGNPGVITVSDGKQITAADLAKFNARWMQPYVQEQERGASYWWLRKRFDAGAWSTGERMAALARMYELTRDVRYLNHLREFIELALEFRDDRHPGYTEKDPATGEVIEDFPPKPLDEIRGRAGLPAWGGRSPNSGGLHRVDEVVSSVYAYPIATFARIVAEDPTLHAAFAFDAVRYANAVLETVWLFIPQIRYRSVGNLVEAWLTLPENYRLKPTENDCDRAYEKAMKGEPDKKERWEEMRRNCRSLRLGAGRPVAHNESFAFAMVLIELSRALDSQLYRSSPLASNDAEPTRTLVPLLVSRQQRFFVNRLHPVHFTSVCGSIVSSLCWHYSEDLAAGIKYRAEDTSHGALDMRYLELLRRDYDRLNALPAAVGEPIPLDKALLRGFANTFLQVIAAGTNFRKGVAGGAAEPADLRNGECDGWMNLAVADVKVYRRCHEMSLRVVNDRQPYLGIGNHSALLLNKRYLPDPKPQPKPACPSGRKCCEFADDGKCTMCVPKQAQCP